MCPLFEKAAPMVPEISRRTIPSFDFIKVFKENDVIHIALNNPGHYNILTKATMEELILAFKWAQQEAGKLVLLESTDGGGFSSGSSNAEETPANAEVMNEVFGRLLQAVFETEKVIICAIQNSVRHRGVVLALCCDIILMSEMAAFNIRTLPMGRFDPFAAYFLPRMLPWPIAVEMLTSQFPFKAERLEQLGIANAVLTQRYFKDDVERFIYGKFDLNSGFIMAKAKKAARAGMNKDFAEVMKEINNIYKKELMPSFDYKEGYDAYMGNRKAVWQNK